MTPRYKSQSCSVDGRWTTNKTAWQQPWLFLLRHEDSVKNLQSNSIKWHILDNATLSVIRGPLSPDDIITTDVSKLWFSASGDCSLLTLGKEQYGTIYMTVSLQSSDSVVPLKAPFWLRRCARKKRAPEKGGPTEARQEGSNWECIGLQGCTMCWGGRRGGRDGVGGRAEQTKMPGGWLNNTGFDE